MSSKKPSSSANDLATAENYFRSGRSEMAELVLRQVVARDPKSSRAYELMAYIQGNRGDLKACEAMLRQACSLPNASGEAFFYLGRVQLGSHRAGEATASFERAIALAGPSFEPLHELGVAHSKLGHHDRALASFAAAERQRPDSAELHFNMGRTLEELQQLDDALGHYTRSLQLNPGQSGVWSNRGVVLTALRHPAEAIDSFDRALALEPNDVQTLTNKAATLNAMQRRVEALACYEAALRLAPRTDDLLGDWLISRLYLCQWDGLAEAFAEIVQRAARGERVSPPFAMLTTPADAPTLLAACRSYALAKYPAAPPAEPPAAPRSDAGKIRLGYFSADFYTHATSHLMARLFELHDRERFELIGFSFGPQLQDAMRERIAAAFDRFIDVSGQTDREITALARSLGVDIAVDLKGFTTHARTGIFAHRAAPVQVNYLGFPGTMACDYIDYIIADETLIRPGEHVHYSEKVVLLPDCYQVND
ncbi:MAG TPA: tetratricopeptide repeat protein, partial [Variovorax sp.]